MTVSFGPVDRLNVQCGYQIRIEDDDARPLLFTSINPSTGEPLESPEDCMFVASYYLNVTVKSGLYTEPNNA